MGAHRPRRRDPRRAVLIEPGEASPPPKEASALAGADRRAGAFYGRRKAQKLRAGLARLVDDVLPDLRIDLAGLRPDPAALFPRPVRELRLEIGFGGGEHLLARALENPDVGFIGCEVFLNGVAKLTARVSEAGLSNILIHDGDAALLLAALPDACLEEVALLYPDPWPKRRQRKRRFVSDERLAGIARLLRPGGVLRFATDIDDYAGWTLAHAQRSPTLAWTAERAGDWRAPWPSWPGTRYEAKARREGRTPSYLTFARNDAPPGTS